MSGMTIEQTLARLQSEQDEERWRELMEAVVAHDDELVLEQVTRLLRSDDPAEQALGADVAAWMPPPRPAITPLLRAVLERTRSDLVVIAAAHAVDQLALRELGPQLAAHAGALGSDARAAVARALSLLEMADRALQADVLIRLAHDPDAYVRGWALFALGGAVNDHEWLDTPAAVAAYRANVEDPDPHVHEEAQQALASLGDIEQLAVVLGGYDDPDGELVALARELGDPALHEPLTELRAWIDDDESGYFSPAYVALVEEALAATASRSA